MKKNNLFLLLILLAALPLNAQQKQADSLLKKLSEPGITDQNKARLLIETGFAMRRVQTDKAAAYTREGLTLAQKIKDRPLITKGYYNMAYVYEALGKLDDAIIAADSCELIVKKDSTLYEALWNAASIKGIVNRRKARFAESLENLMKALSIAEKNNSQVLIGKSLSNLGIFYVTQKDLDRAEEFHQQALAIRLKVGNPKDVYQTYENLGIVNRERKRYDKALEYYFKALEIAKTMNDSSSLSFTYNDIGAAHSFQGTLDKAEKYLKASIDIRERMGEKAELAYTYNYLGENYERQKNLIAAEQHIKKAMAVAWEIQNTKQMYESLESLSDFYSRNNRFDSAYVYLQKYRFFRDSLSKKDRAEVVADLTTKYESEKKERQIQTQQFELTRKNYWIAAIVFLFISLLITGYLLYHRKQLRQRAELQQEVIRQQDMAAKAIVEAEEKERQRIAKDLHDGIGQIMSAAKMNLSSIETQIPFVDKAQQLKFENIISLVDESCREIRAVSHNMMPNALLKAGLAAAIREFIDRIDHSVLKVDLSSEGLNERMDSNVETVLYRVIQECVNNVIKHSGANHLDISLIKDKDGISVTIEDNGKGFDVHQKMQKAGGMGLKNIITRVEYLKGSVEFDSLPGKGTLVAIHIPENRMN